MKAIRAHNLICFGVDVFNSLPPTVTTLDDLVQAGEDMASLLKSKGTSIENLILQGSPITHLPPEIHYLKNLRGLTIKDCESLISLPKQIGSLATLSFFSCSGCQLLTTFPKEVGNWIHLLEFMCSDCQSFTSLPKEVGNWEKLIHFTCEGCPSLTFLPDEIGNWKDLNYFTCHKCTSLSAFPEALQKLEKLQYLFCKDCSTSLHFSQNELLWIKRLGMRFSCNEESLPQEVQPPECHPYKWKIYSPDSSFW